MSSKIDKMKLENLVKLEVWTIIRTDDGAPILYGQRTAQDGKSTGLIRTSTVRALAFLDAPEDVSRCFDWIPGRIVAFTDHTLYELRACSDPYEVVSILINRRINLPGCYLTHAA